MLTGSLAILTPIVLTSCSTSSKYENAIFQAYLAPDNSYSLTGDTREGGSMMIHINFLKTDVANLTVESSYIYNNQTYTVDQLDVTDNGCTGVHIQYLSIKGCNLFRLNDSTRPRASVTNITNIVTLNTKRILFSAFSGCTGLRTITIPDSVSIIESRTFEGCTGLTSVTIPKSVNYIEHSAFQGCINLPSIEIPDGVTTIEDSAFQNCTGLTSFVIPNSVTSIGDSVFCDCIGLTSITIPDSVTTIGDSVFYGCNLTSINIPNSITTIGVSAFSHCKLLTSLNIPDGVTSIGDYAFYDCTGLTSITIPDSVTTIGDSAFKSLLGKDSLTSVTIPQRFKSNIDNLFNNPSNITFTYI